MFKKIVLALSLMMFPASSYAASFACGGVVPFDEGNFLTFIVGQFDPDTGKITDTPVLLINNNPVYFWTPEEAEMKGDEKTWFFAVQDNNLAVGVSHPEGSENQTSFMLMNGKDTISIENGICRFQK